MKVTFIIPPQEHFIESYVTKKLDKGREFRQKLGILCVAGYLRDVGGVVPRVVDSLADALTSADLRRMLAEEQPDIIGFSVLTFNILDCLEVARIAREVSPKTKICFGGFHPTLYPRETLALDAVDLVVFGEGEITFTSLVHALRDHAGASLEQALADIPGLAWKDSDGKLHVNEAWKAPDPDRLDYLAMPAHDLVDIEKYTVVLSNESRVAAIQTSRGCPSKCTFCDIRLTKHRHRSTEHVMRELRMLKDRGIREFFIIDDTFTINRKRVIELCNRMIEEKLDIPYKISSRVDRIDPELLDILAKSGCYRIHYGIESGTQRMLDYMQKGVTLEQSADALKITRSAGIESFAYMMIGVPTETRSEIDETIRFVDRTRPDYLNYSICTPFPKTFLYEDALKRGEIGHDYWLDFAVKPQADFKIRVLNRNFTEGELRQIQDGALRRFYSSPSRIWKELLRTKDWNQLMVKAKIGARIVLPRL